MAVSKTEKTKKSKQLNKTIKTEKSVEDFLDSIEDEQRRLDCHKIVELMKKATKTKPKMWGESIVGFGEYHYKYESGREGDSCIVGFSPRKQNLTLYVRCGHEKSQELLKKLGKHKVGGGCLYIKHLADVDLSILSKLISEAFNKHKS